MALFDWRRVSVRGHTSRLRPSSRSISMRVLFFACVTATAIATLPADNGGRPTIAVGDLAPCSRARARASTYTQRMQHMCCATGMQACRHAHDHAKTSADAHARSRAPHMHARGARAGTRADAHACRHARSSLTRARTLKRTFAHVRMHAACTGTHACADMHKRSTRMHFNARMHAHARAWTHAYRDCSRTHMRAQHVRM